MQIGHVAPRTPPPVRPRVAATRLLKSPLLSIADRDSLGSAISSVKTVGPGQILIRESDDTHNMYLILDGWACRYATTRSGGRQISALLLPGDTANIDSLLFNQTDYGVRGFTPLTVAVLPSDRVRILARTHTSIAETFSWLALADNAVLRRWALSLGRKCAKERIAHLLCELSARLDPDCDNHSSIPLPISQEHIADMVGLTSVHVNRTLKELRCDGLVELSFHQVTLPDVAQLRRVAGFDSKYLDTSVSVELPN